MLKKIFADCLCGVGILLILGGSSLALGQFGNFCCSYNASTCTAVQNSLSGKCDAATDCSNWLLTCSCQNSPRLQNPELFNCKCMH
jgi:hypothetical protein